MTAEDVRAGKQTLQTKGMILIGWMPSAVPVLLIITTLIFLEVQNRLLIQQTLLIVRKTV